MNWTATGIRPLRVTSLTVGLLVWAMFFTAGPLDATGVTGFDLLTLPASAKANALGGAYTAYADEGSGLFYNVAGISQIYYPQAGVVRTEFPQVYNTSARLDDVPAYNQLYYVHPLSYGSLGVSFRNLSSGNIEVVDDNFNVTNQSASDTVISAAYGVGFGDLSVGLGYNLLDSQLGGFSSRTWGVDLGLMYFLDMPAIFDRYKNNNFSLAVAARNLGPGIQYGQQVEPQPFNYSAGFSYSIIYYKTFEPILFAEYNNLYNQNEFIRVGLETMIYRYFYIRGGLESVISGISEQSMKLSAGAGIKLPAYGRRFTVNWAVSPDVNGNGLYNQFGVNITFGGAPDGLPWLNFSSKTDSRANRVYLTAEEKERLSELDGQILLMLRMQILSFEKERGRYPSDLNELLLYLNEKNIYDIPNPKNGRYVYDKRKGFILVK